MDGLIPIQGIIELQGAKMAEIKASQQNLNNVFSNSYFFEIPTYQRPYSWETEQVGELLDDLLNAMERNDQEPYFLGSIVLVKDEMDSKSEVIDGQQRLTTLSMLFCVLRELASDSIKAGLDNRIREAGDPLLGTPDRFRVNLRQLDREFFHDNVQDGGHLEQFLKLDSATFTTDSQKQISENVAYLYDRMGQLDEKTRDDLARYIIRYCYLVVVTTEDKGSAYRIFSVMNDRGLSLSPTDILKAELVGAMVIPKDEREYGDKWEEIERELGRDDFQNLFGHLRMIYLKTKQQKTLQEEFQNSILESTPEKAKEFIDKVLEPYSDVYGEVARASYESSEGAESVNLYLRHLNRLDNSDWVPPAMAFFHRNQNNKDSLFRFTKDLERLAYGMFIRRADVNERIRRYADVLHAIERDEDLWLEEGPLQLNDNEKTEILNALDGPIYLQTRVRLPVVLRLDNLLTDAGAYYQHSTITIEHVLPQNPAADSQWMKWFPDDAERGQWTHRIANLVLLSWRKNSSASNREFERKKSEYFQRKGVTPFALTTQVVSESEWTPKVLSHRQGQLINAFKKEWRLD